MPCLHTDSAGFTPARPFSRPVRGAARCPPGAPRLDCSQVRKFPCHGSAWSRVGGTGPRGRARPDARERRTWSRREVAGGLRGPGQAWVQTQSPAGSPRGLGAVGSGRPSQGSPEAGAWACIPCSGFGEGAAGSTPVSQGAGWPSRSQTFPLPAPVSLSLSRARQPASDRWDPPRRWVGLPAGSWGSRSLGSTVNTAWERERGQFDCYCVSCRHGGPCGFGVVAPSL